MILIGSPPDVVAAAHALVRQGRFQRVKQEILQAHPGARLISEEETTLTQAGQRHKGMKAAVAFEDMFAHRFQPVRSYVSLFDDGKWAIKYRITYPNDSHDVVPEAINEFMNALAWSR